MLQKGANTMSTAKSFPTREHVQLHSVSYDPTHNLYADNIDSIRNNDELNINVGNIRFKVIYNSFRFSEIRHNSPIMVPHTHPYYELHIIKRGDHKIILDETSVHLHSGNRLVYDELPLPFAFHTNHIAELYQ